MTRVITVELELSDKHLEEINRYDTKNNMSTMTYNATSALLDEAIKA